jgi:hypothetical protein
MFMGKTTSKNPKCHLHIPQPRNGIFVLNTFIQGLDKRRCEEKGSQGNTQNPKVPNRGYRNLMEVKTLMATLKETKLHTCRVELQGLLNQSGKKNDE